MCVLSFCFPACSPFLFPAYGKRRLNIIPAKCSPVSALPIPGYGKFSKNTYFFSGAKVFNELPVIFPATNIYFCNVTLHVSPVALIWLVCILRIVVTDTLLILRGGGGGYSL